MSREQQLLHKSFPALHLLVALSLLPLAAGAAKQETSEIREASVYIIKDGDFLGGIAMAHGISVNDLIEANGMENPDKIFSGMELMIPGAKMNSGDDGDRVRVPRKIEQKVFVEVPRGFTLSRIAKVYGVSVAAILRGNKKLKNADSVRAGMKLFIPGATEEIELVPPPPCFSPAVEFYRIRNDKSEMIHLTFCNGKPNPAGVDRLSHFSSPTNLDEMPFPLHPRLAVLLQKIANQFPGRRLEIVSGQRIKKDRNHESFHSKGQAIDFRVAGLPNRTLVNFIRQFDNTGVGFYPNSVFVHMDTRKRDAFWIDYSRPGEKAIYAKAGMTQEDVEKIRITRLTRKAGKKFDVVDEDRTADESSDEPSDAPSIADVTAPTAISSDKNEHVETRTSEAGAEKATKEIASIQSSGQA